MLRLIQFEIQLCKDCKQRLYDDGYCSQCKNTPEYITKYAYYEE